jgi:hypothetical protein
MIVALAPTTSTCGPATRRALLVTTAMWTPANSDIDSLLQQTCLVEGINFLLQETCLVEGWTTRQ